MTKPRSEQIRFISAATGTEVILDAYIESAELGGRTIADILGDIFDVTGTFRADIFEFREDPSNPGILQSRVGDFVDPNAGWTDLSNTDFQSFITSCEVAETGANDAWAAALAVYDQTVIVYNQTIGVRADAIAAQTAAEAAQSAAETAQSGAESARDASGDAATLAGTHVATTHGYMTTTEGYRDQTLMYRNETEGFKNDAEAAASAATTHIASTDNPHSVTKAQVGLGNVDNTSDANKPISSATQGALNAKFDVSGGTLSGPLLRDANFKIDIDGDDPTFTFDLKDKIVFDRSHDTLGVVINDLYHLAISPSNVHVYGNMSTAGTLSPLALNVQSNASVAGTLTRAGNTVWDTGNFDPALKADLAGDTFTGSISVRETTAHGLVQVYSGSTAHPGYVQFVKPDGTGLGYVGWSDGDDWIKLQHMITDAKGFRANGSIRQDGIPAFSAVTNTAGTQGLGTIAFGAAITNNGSHYSTGTNRFTAPFAGRYAFSGSVFFQFTSANVCYGAWQFYKNGAAVGRVNHTPAVTSSNSYQSVSGTVVLYLNAGDYVTVNCTVLYWCVVYQSSFSSFSGHLIG